MNTIAWMLAITYVAVGSGLLASIAVGSVDMFVLLAVLFAVLAVTQRLYFTLGSARSADIEHVQQTGQR